MSGPFPKAADVPFMKYARFYDLFYATKDYRHECDFLEGVFRRAENPVRDVLDLGCGTGGHASGLADRGYAITGVDRSTEMLAVARRKRPVGVEWLEGDIRALDLARRFDAVICMFAVLSYQATDDDLTAALATVRAHLRPGGCFVFDCWFGPAVAALGPESRTAEYVWQGHRVRRRAVPHVDRDRHLVAVDYRIDEDGDREVSVEETHVLRYLFPDELRSFLGRAGMELRGLWPTWDLSRAPTERDWNVVGIAGVSGAPSSALSLP